MLVIALFIYKFIADMIMFEGAYNMIYNCEIKVN